MAGVVNSFELLDGKNSLQGVLPQLRTSKGSPVVTRRINTSSQGKGATSVSNQLIFSNNIEQLVNISDKPKPKPRTSKQRNKEVDIKSNTTFSEDTINESLSLLQRSNSDSSLNTSNNKKLITKHVDYSDNQKIVSQSTDFNTFAKGGLEVKLKGKHDNYNEFNKLHQSADPYIRQTARTVRLTGGKKQTVQSAEYSTYAREQGLQLGESLGSDSSLKGAVNLPSRQVSFDKTGKRQVSLSNDFEEYSISTLNSLSEQYLESSHSTKSNHKPKTKKVDVKEGAANVSYSEEFEDFSFNALQSLHDVSEVDISSVQSKSRQVTSHVSFVDGTKNLRYSDDFQNYSRSIGGLHNSRDFHSETDLDTLSKSHDRDVTSWIEYKDGKRHVHQSDQFQTFAQGLAIEYTNKPKTDHNRRDILKKVEYKRGKRHVSYSDEFLNSLNSEYSDDFENSATSASSWAVKVRNNSLHSPVTKRVEYIEGKKHVSYTTDAEHSIVDADYTEDFETGTSFREISIEDIEDRSYTEDFESLTAGKGLSFARPTGSELSIGEDTEVWSSSTPHTSIHTSNHQSDYTSRAHITNADSTLHSESFETVTSVPQSESEYSDGSSRYRSKVETFNRSESELDSETDADDYSMTFTAVEDTIEESPEIKKQTQDAKISFIKKKLKILQKPSKPKYIPLPKEEKLSGTEAIHFNTFLKRKLKVIERKSNTLLNSQDDSQSCKEFKNSTRCQLKGISLDDQVEDYGISPSVIARLKMENTMHNVNRAASQDIHDPRTCEKCSEKMGEYAARQFMWHKKAVVSEKLVQEKMEMQILQLQDPMWLYAEALRGLPKLTDDREEIYDKLMRPLYESYAQNATVNYKDSFHPP